MCSAALRVYIFTKWNPLLCRNKFNYSFAASKQHQPFLLRFRRVINPSTANAKTQLQRITWQRKGILLMWQVQRMKCHANREISHTEPAWVSLYMCQTDYMARFYSVHYNKYYASHYWSYIYVHYFWTNDRWTAASSVKTTSTLYAPRNRNKVILVLLLTVQLHIVSTILNYRRNKKQNKYLNDRFVDQEIETTTYYCCSSHWPRCPPPVRATCGATTKYILHKSLSSIPRFCRPPVQRRLVV